MYNTYLPTGNESAAGYLSKTWLTRSPRLGATAAVVGGYNIYYNNSEYHQTWRAATVAGRYLIYTYNNTPYKYLHIILLLCINIYYVYTY